MSKAHSVADIEQLIAEFERSGLHELHVIHDGLEIYLSNDPDAAPIFRQGKAVGQPIAGPREELSIAARPPTGPSAVPLAIDLPAGAVVVVAPYLGTFYRSPKPGSAPYVEVGSAVGADAELCLVEVMKLFTTVRAGVAGTVHAVLAKDGDLVAADQPLFAIVPA